ncbi:hypothetical protein KDW_39450 [Dictyobacter vulcani]|uniref:NYN domain-containing protein n=1 Tax=Dictyobacter vulcani TaxID=2607529 RepID=A0A5J4KQA7_9CHLR|nr:NYN domain-containing protein [Dictyobacter vulcani]GER89783.1 hypothetical protein KDW_39450 [Dictyobacter vulcani]
MVKEKVIFFLDYANINRAAREKRYQLDYHDLLQYVGEERFLLDAHCYVPINPRNEHRLDGAIEDLWRAGYIVTTKVGTIAGGTYKCNFDVEITMDILKVVYQVKPDIIVLATGDADFVPLIQDVRKSGVRVEVAAFVETAGAQILNKCSGFIDLDVYFGGYLAAQQEPLEQEGSVEPYHDLIQSQQDEQKEVSEHDKAEQDEDLLPSHESDELEETVACLVEQMEKQPLVSAPDLSDGPDIYVPDSREEGGLHGNH